MIIGFSSSGAPLIRTLGAALPERQGCPICGHPKGAGADFCEAHYRDFAAIDAHSVIAANQERTALGMTERYRHTAAKA